MNIQVILQFLLRLIPAVFFAVVGFLAVRDARLKDLWVDFLIKTGSVSEASREDEQIQKSLRWPFLAVAVIFLIWPIYYLVHDSYAQRPATVIAVPLPKATATPEPSVKMQQATPTATPYGLAPSGGGALPQPIQGQSAPQGAKVPPAPVPVHR
jgi:hypothetical protein